MKLLTIVSSHDDCFLLALAQSSGEVRGSEFFIIFIFLINSNENHLIVRQQRSAFIFSPTMIQVITIHDFTHSFLMMLITLITYEWICVFFSVFSLNEINLQNRTSNLLLLHTD